MRCRIGEDAAILTGGYQGTIALPGSALSITNPSTTSYNSYVAKLDTSGNGVWLKEVGASGLLATDAKADVLITASLVDSGSFGGPIITSAGGTDVVVGKLKGSDGSLLWQRQFGDASNQTPTWITAGNLGEVVVTGNFTGTLGFDAATLTASGSTTAIFVAKIAP